MIKRVILMILVYLSMALPLYADISPEPEPDPSPGTVPPGTIPELVLVYLPSVTDQGIMIDPSAYSVPTSILGSFYTLESEENLNWGEHRVYGRLFSNASSKLGIDLYVYPTEGNAKIDYLETSNFYLDEGFFLSTHSPSDDQSTLLFSRGNYKVLLIQSGPFVINLWAMNLSQETLLSIGRLSQNYLPQGDTP